MSTLGTTIAGFPLRQWLIGLSGLASGMVVGGKVRVEVKQRFALCDAAEAHRALEARETSGSTVLTI